MYNAAPLESVRPSPHVCACCHTARGYLYTTVDGSVEVCPWCVADGSAHAQFPDAIINDCDLLESTTHDDDDDDDDDTRKYGHSENDVHPPHGGERQPHHHHQQQQQQGSGTRRIPAHAWQQLMHQTPRFMAWQDTLWWTHCGDAAVYRGMGGWHEMQAAGPAMAAFFLQYYLDEFHGDRASWEAFARKTGKDYDRTAYLFTCRHCKACGGYIDMR